MSTTATRTPSATAKASAANAAAAKTARPGAKPAIHVAGSGTPDVLAGVTAPKETARTRAAKALADATANAKNPFELAAIKAGPLAVGAKARAPKAAKADVAGAKQDLARRVILAIGAEIKASDGTEKYREVMSKVDAAKLCAQWLHYLPVGPTWPKGTVPVPERSEWNVDGTRV
jgi:hypothetical protein